MHRVRHESLDETLHPCNQRQWWQGQHGHLAAGAGARAACEPASDLVDTGHEHAAVYDYLAYLEQTLGVSITRLRADFSEQMANKRLFIARDQRMGRDKSGKRLRWTNKAERRALAVLHATGRLIATLPHTPERIAKAMA